MPWRHAGMKVRSCFGRIRTASSEFLTEHSCRLHLVAKFSVGFVDAHHCAGAGCETAVGVQCDTLLSEELKGLAHTVSDGLSRIDAARSDIHAAQTNFKVFAQLAEHRHVARLRRGEFHREVVNLQLVEMPENRAISTFMRLLASCPRAGAPAQMH